MTGSYDCPVCGFGDLHEEPFTDAGGGSYEICPSCGFEFGVTDDDKGETYVSWRARWVAGGMQWWAGPEEAPPAGWDPRAQLAALEPDA